MNNTIAMEQHFERNKNLQASAVTAFVCVVVFLIFFYIRWQLPVIEKPLLIEGIEVNIGFSDQGSGDVQPLVQGDPAPESTADNSSTPPSGSSTPATSTDNTNDNDPDAVPTSTTTPNTKPVTNPNPNPIKPKAVVTPAPVTPKPKATFDKKYTGGNGNGGNNKDGYNDSRSEGNDKPGTSGDKGKPWGSIDGTVYDGPGGTKVKGLGKRKMRPLPSFEDDFNEDAKVAIDIIVDVNGNVKPVAINPVGTSTTNKKTRAVAMKRAAEIKFEPNKEVQRGTIILDMRVRG
jgi:hypothetical protein